MADLLCEDESPCCLFSFMLAAVRRLSVCMSGSCQPDGQLTSDECALTDECHLQADKAAGAAPASDPAGADNDAAAPIGPAAAPQHESSSAQQAAVNDQSGRPATANGAEPSSEEAAAAEQTSDAGLIGPPIGPQIGAQARPAAADGDSNGAGPQASDHDTAALSPEHAIQHGKRDRPDVGKEAGVPPNESRPMKKPLLSFGDDDDDT